MVSMETAEKEKDMASKNNTLIDGELGIPIFTREEGQRRWKKIRELMMQRQIDCLLICGSTFNYRSGYGDIRYISNACPYTDDAFVVFPLQGDPILYVWSRSSQYWAEKVSWMPVAFSQWTPQGNTYPRLMADKIKDLGLEKGTLGIVDEFSWLVYAYERLKALLPRAKLVDAGEILRTVRLIKNPGELEYVRKAGKCADKGWEALKNTAKHGVSQNDLIAALESAMARNGAEVATMNLLGVKQWPDGWGFPFGSSDRKLKKGDIINCEITPSYGGYYAQLVRPISLGTPPDDFYAQLEIDRAMYRMAVKEMRPGNVAQEISDKISNWAMKRGRPFSFASPCFQMLDNMTRTPLYMGELQPGMVFMVHPMTYPPEPQLEKRQGHGGHLIGDTYIITASEPEPLSHLPFDVAIV